MRGKVGFYINHGVEVRYFILSGLLDLIRKNFDVCFYTNDVYSKTLDNYAVKYNIKVKILPINKISKPKFESYLRTFTNARKRSNNISIYNHFGNLPPEKFYDGLLKIPFLSFLGNYFFRLLSIKFYKSKELISFFRQENIHTLYQLQYESLLLKVVGINASLSGADVVVFINTLKTVFIDDFVAFKIDRLYSWSKVQNNLFQRANIGIKKSAFLPYGSPYHNFLRTPDNIEKQKVIEKYNLNIERPIILYSLINEKVYNKEHIVIELIVKYFENHFENTVRPQIVIRRNPFEQVSEHVKYLKSVPGVIIAEHFWERNEEKEWSIQTEDGELEWRALLQIASISMNIPSMATIDSLVCGTPVVNIGFNVFGEYNKELEFLIQSPFNKEFEKNEYVKTCLSLNELKLYFSGNIMENNKLREAIAKSIEMVTISNIENYI